MLNPEKTKIAERKQTNRAWVPEKPWACQRERQRVTWAETTGEG